MELGSEGQERERGRFRRRRSGAEDLGLGRVPNIPGTTRTPGARPQSMRVRGPVLTGTEPSDPGCASVLLAALEKRFG